MNVISCPFCVEAPRRAWVANYLKLGEHIRVEHIPQWEALVSAVDLGVVE